MDDNEDAARGYAAQNGDLAVMFEDDGDPSYDVPSEVADTTQAEKSLRAVRYFSEKIEALKAHRDAEMARIEQWYEREAGKFSRRIQWHESGLRAFLWATGEKTVSLVNGTLKRRAARQRVDVVMPELFIGWAKKSGHAEMVRVTEAPDKKAVADYVKKTGEEPPGVEINKGEDSFSYEV